MDLLQKKVTVVAITFFDGFVLKKMTTKMPSPFSMVVVLWSFWSNSLELTINNEMVVFWNVEGYNS
jgi:hypothetical protein